MRVAHAAAQRERSALARTRGVFFDRPRRAAGRNGGAADGAPLPCVPLTARHRFASASEARRWGRILSSANREPRTEPTRPLYISYAVFCLKKKNDRISAAGRVYRLVSMSWPNKTKHGRPRRITRRREVDDRVRDVLGLPDAPRGQPRGRRRVHRFARRVVELRPQRRRDEPRRHGVHAHRRELESEPARKRLERRVDRALQHRARARPHAQEAGHERERPARRDARRARDAVCAPELAVHRRLRVGERQLAHGPAGRVRGRHDDVVERAGLGEEGVDRGRIRRIEHRLPNRARAVDRPCGARELVRVARCDRHVGVQHGERVGGRGADPGTAADDEDALIVERSLHGVIA